MSKIYLSKEGYDKYLEELELIKKKIEKNSIDISEYASDDAYGDGWHDNFAYEEARRHEQRLFKECEIKLKGLNEIEIIEKDNSDKIGIEDLVFIELKFSDTEIEREWYKISGSTKSDLDNEILHITVNSPLRKTLLGKKINEEFFYHISNEKVEGKILDIKK